MALLGLGFLDAAAAACLRGLPLLCMDGRFLLDVTPTRSFMVLVTSVRLPPLLSTTVAGVEAAAGPLLSMKLFICLGAEVVDTLAVVSMRTGFTLWRLLLCWLSTSIEGLSVKADSG